MGVLNYLVFKKCIVVHIAANSIYFLSLLFELFMCHKTCKVTIVHCLSPLPQTQQLH